MKKRMLAGVLWAFTACYAWNMVAAVVGVSELPGIGLGVTAAILVAGDPLGRIWGARRRAQDVMTTTSPSANAA